MDDSLSWNHLPPGFRFHPTDEELVVHYLKPKAEAAPLPLSNMIGEVELYKFDPWELPGKATFALGEQEWYFFSPRDRKYPNGTRPNRAATSGYWKATGTDKPILSHRVKVGVKKALVFYGGRPPKGIKTNWIMHEYRLTQPPPPSPLLLTKKHPPTSLRLDDWVLCRIYKKGNGHGHGHRPMGFMHKPAGAGGDEEEGEDHGHVNQNYHPTTMLDGNQELLLHHHVKPSPYWTQETLQMPLVFHDGGGGMTSRSNNNNNSTTTSVITRNNNDDEEDGGHAAMAALLNHHHHHQQPIFHISGFNWT